MKTFDNLGLAEIKKLFSQKKEYIINNNFEGLLDLKKKYPFLFDPQQEVEYDKLLDYIHMFSNLPHIQHQLRMQQKSRLIEVNMNEWHLVEYEELLVKTPVVNISNIKEISRALVRNSILISNDVFSEMHINDRDTAFACIGFLLGEILSFIDSETRVKHQNRIIHILTGSSDFDSDAKNPSIISIEIKQKIKEKFRAQYFKLFSKFDKRIEFRNDIIFFCLIEIAEYISLIQPLFIEISNRKVTLEIITNMIEVSVHAPK